MPVLPTGGNAVDADRSPTNVRVVPDLGDELLIVIDRLEALLGSMAVWEVEDDVGLPAPFADRKALGALQAAASVVRPTQGRDEPQVVSGRLSRRGWTGRRLPPHFVPIPDAPLATLEHAVQILAVQRAYHDLNAAVEQYTAVVGEPPLALVSCLSRTVSLLTPLGRRCQETVEISYRAPRQVRHRAQSQRAASLRSGRPAHRRSVVLPTGGRPTAFLTPPVPPPERPRHPGVGRGSARSAT
jgi:hypothetical protein